MNEDDVSEKLRQLSERMVIQSEQITNLIKIGESSQNNFVSLAKEVASINIEVASGKASLNTVRALGVAFCLLIGWFCQHLLSSYEDGDNKQQVQIESMKNDINDLRGHDTQQEAQINSVQKQVNDLDNRVTMQGVSRR